MHVPIGNETLSVDLPDDFRVEQNEDGSTFACLRDKDFAEVYFSACTITPSVPTETDLGYDGVAMKALEDGKSAAVVDGKSVHQTERESRRRGGKRRIHEWYVGYRNFAVVITVTILAKPYEAPETRQVLSLVPNVIRSIRELNEDA